MKTNYILPFQHKLFKVEEGFYIYNNKNLYISITKDVYKLLMCFKISTSIESAYQKFIPENSFITFENFTIIFCKLEQAGVFKEPHTQLDDYFTYLSPKFILFNESFIFKVGKYLKKTIPSLKFLLTIVFTINLVIGCYLFYIHSLNGKLIEYANIKSLIIVGLVELLSVLFHEFGHASAAIKFNTKVQNIGIGFYLLSPVFFTNVTDSWLLKKNNRIVVSMAGIYFDSIFFACLLLLSIFFFHSASFLIAITYLLKLTINLNPFLKYDGYWALSDWINVKKLRANSNKVLKAFFLNFQMPITKRSYFLLLYSATYRIIFLYIIISILKNYKELYHFPLKLLYLAKSDVFSFSTIITFIFYNLWILILYSLLIKYSFYFFKQIKNNILK